MWGENQVILWGNNIERIAESSQASRSQIWKSEENSTASSQPIKKVMGGEKNYSNSFEVSEQFFILTELSFSVTDREQQLMSVI